MKKGQTAYRFHVYTFKGESTGYWLRDICKPKELVSHYRHYADKYYIEQGVITKLGAWGHHECQQVQVIERLIDKPIGAYQEEMVRVTLQGDESPSSFQSFPYESAFQSGNQETIALLLINHLVEHCNDTWQVLTYEAYKASHPSTGISKRDFDIVAAKITTAENCVRFCPTWLVKNK